MDSIKHLRPLVALLAVTLMAALPAGQAEAQETGSRYRVLVPNLTPQNDADEDFGEDVADRLRDLIDDMPTHAPIGERDLRDALRRFQVSADDLNCLRARQLAVQLGAELVMCGSYTEPSRRQYMVEAQFVSARTGETFTVDAFPADDDRPAAERIVSEFRNYVEQLRQMAFCLQDVGNQQYNTALDRCRQALEANPESNTARYAVARSLLGLAEAQDEAGTYTMPEAERTAQLQESLTLLQQVLEENPVHQEALQTAGFVSVKLDDRAQALDYYRQYLELNPGAANVRVTIATDLSNAGDPEGALRLVQEGIEAAGEEPDPILLEYAGHFAMNAAAAIESGDAEQGEMAPADLYDTAVRNYERVYELRGAETDPTLLRRMMQAMSQTERTTDAIALGERLTSEFPQDAALWDAYANALNRAGRTQDAMQALQRLAEIDPEARVYARQGLWLAREGNFERAKDAFQQAAQRGEAPADDFAETIFGIGYRDYYQQGQHDVALRAFDVSRELATSAQKRARANFWMGYILYQRGQRVQEPSTVASARQALPLFERALQHFQNARGYTEADNLPQIIDATNQFIEIQNLLIRRGR